jgi:hypothetical protein
MAIKPDVCCLHGIDALFRSDARAFRHICAVLLGLNRGEAPPIHEGQAMKTMNSDTTAYELRFRSLFKEGRALTFPCDAGGQVDLDALSERARHNYFFARTVIGREFSLPEVRPDGRQ